MTCPRRSPGSVAISPETLGRAPHLGPLDVADHALRVAAWTLLDGRLDPEKSDIELSAEKWRQLTVSRKRSSRPQRMKAQGSYP